MGESNNFFMQLIITFLLIVILAVAITVIYSVKGKKKARGKREPVELKRSPKNPIIRPRQEKGWDSQGSFNPAAVKVDGKTHLLYRAVGSEGVSRIGHASVKNGADVDERSPRPVYEPSAGFDLPEAGEMEKPREYNPMFYTSGGSWGGCEDPRAVVIDDRIYMTYVAFGGWNSVRIALTSISIRDFRKRLWNWKKAVFISPPGQVNKNWVLFPEKIKGKYAILHSIAPKILIDYVDSLEHFPKGFYIKSSGQHGGGGYHDIKREKFWDNQVRGAGAPPLKTKLGWLLLYHAVDKRDPGKYKVGAMILDSKEPTKILYRAPAPILSPKMCYENDGKPGVVYASGAVIVGSKLFIYYGGGDKNVCVAETPLRGLLNWLVEYGKVN
jgi:predicted GH43/DUF377 family glycosyl hydrolase